jgi:hypothetical protein
VGSSAPAIAKALEKGHGKKNAAFTIQALDAVAAAGTEEGLELVLRYAKSEDAALRAVAMGSLGRLLVGEALQALIAGLDDSESNVRSAALRTLARKRDKSIIGPLIAFLGKEKEDRLRVDALQLLVGLTGQNMGLVAEDWSKWWEIAADKFEFPKEGGEKKFTDVKAYDLTYFGIEVASKRLGFLVDASGSMTETVAVRTRRPGEKEPEDDKEPSGKTAVGKDGDGKAGGGKDGGDVPVKDGRAKKIDILKKELTRLLKKLPPETQINILSFDADFEAWQKELQPLAGQGRARAVQFVQGLGTGSGTNVFDTLEAALKDKRVDTVYLLTDGLPTRGRLVEPSAILREIAAQNRVRGITIHCIAFGEESPFLKDLAEQNGGQYRFVDSY